MDDLNVIDQFMEAFASYIDSGFGLLGGDVGFLTTILIGIDITLAGLFWALGGEDDVIAKFLKKILYVGVFALILNSFSTLSDIIFRSFAGLGLTAGGSAITADDLLRPGKLAGTGFEAAWPLLEQAKELVGPIAFFDNFIEIAVLVIAWVVVIAAFFILAIQLFITILEFKLTSLAGFVLGVNDAVQPVQAATNHRVAQGGTSPVDGLPLVRALLGKAVGDRHLLIGKNVHRKAARPTDLGVAERVTLHTEGHQRRGGRYAVERLAGKADGLIINV